MEPRTSRLRAVNPDAFALDGSVGTIWGHPDQPGEDYADPWTSLNLGRSLPIDMEMRFSIDPWAWLTADGTFEPNVIVGDASDWSAMTKRVGLDIYMLTPDAAGILLVSPWAAPAQRMPFEPDVWYRYRLPITATEIDHKIWRDGDPEPPAWTTVSTAPTRQSLSMSNAYLWLFNANYGGPFAIDWITMQN
jgi:hypothetical protein